MLIPRLMRCLALVLSATIFLTACGGEVAVNPTPDPTIAPTIIPTATPEPTAPPTATPTPEPTVAPTPTPVAIADPITGAPALARGQVTERPQIIMIDNHPDAYPQAGMNGAAVVFEALAEFGVTRFMVVFAPGITPDMEQIGPVRSARHYYVQWAMGMHGIYAHAGGSPQGLALAESTDQIVNLDAQFDSTSKYFWRSKDRLAPHNLYTNSELLAQANEDLGGSEYDEEDVGFLFKEDAPIEQRPESASLNYYFIYPEDHAGWVYDAETNGYWRLRRGRPAVDARTGEQLWTKNVVVIEVHEAPIPGDEKGRIDQEVIGSGNGRAFIDGIERTITWEKDGEAANLRFYEIGGEEVRLNTGPVWIVAVPSLDNLSTK